MQNNPTSKIALFIPSLAGGGAERVAVTIANGFAARGVAVDLILIRAGGPYMGDVAPEVQIIDLGATRALLALPALVRYLRRERPIALLSFLNYANLVAILAKMFARGNTRVVVKESNSLVAITPKEPRLKDRLRLLSMRYLYPRADKVVAVSDAMIEELCVVLKLNPRKVVAQYNPINFSRIATLASATPDHPWLANGEPPVVVAMGRLTEQKDFPFLLKAFALVRGRRNCRLIVLGEGELRGDLEAQARSLGIDADTDFAGFEKNPYAVLAKASLFVLSSRWEGLPSVLIEALACGAPVVATDCPTGPHEILGAGRWGKLVPMGDVDTMATAIEQVLDTAHKPLPQEVFDRFALSTVIDSYLGLLQAKPD